MIPPSFVAPDCDSQIEGHKLGAFFRIFEAFITSPYSVNYPKSINFYHFAIPKTVVIHNCESLYQNLKSVSTMLLNSNILALKWPQLQVTSNDGKHWHGVLWKLEKLWKGSQLTISAKVKLFYTCVTIFLCGCESWVLSLDMENKIMLLPPPATGSCLG